LPACSWHTLAHAIFNGAVGVHRMGRCLAEGEEDKQREVAFNQ